MKASIIIPFLDSDEIVRRLIKYWGRMNIPDDVEFIIMDDGSRKPLRHPDFGLLDLVKETGLNLEIYETHEYRPWTSSIARNRGAAIATGRTLLLLDGDYIVPEQAIMDVREFTGNKMHMIREFGVLDENGVFTQDRETLIAWGLAGKYKDRGPRLPPHSNQFAMNREVFLEIGGYDEKRVLENNYPQREDNNFKGRWARWREGKSHIPGEYRATIYMYPNGQFCGDVDYNPFGLFHSLSRKTRANAHWGKTERRVAREKRAREKGSK